MPAAETPAQRAARVIAEAAALPAPDTASVRQLRRRHSREMRAADAAFVREVALRLAECDRMRWVGCELVRHHKAAFASADAALLEGMARGMRDWMGVDGFARTLAGPAWLRRQVPDALIRRWALSDDLWLRRAALVSTVALNARSQGGMGDADRTLGVCRILAADPEDMVRKALSWALRELVFHDRSAVRDFLAEHDAVLSARVKRETRHKLATGLKNPRRAHARPRD